MNVIQSMLLCVDLICRSGLLCSFVSELYVARVRLASPLAISMWSRARVFLRGMIQRYMALLFLGFLYAV